jgi:hypothetical protein
MIELLGALVLVGGLRTLFPGLMLRLLTIAGIAGGRHSGGVWLARNAGRSR